ncbi:MAG: hypothetical protein GXP63_02345 [DPANN group archaeon]|nr:hypothetical protein [DPANN group archaeon]
MLELITNRNVLRHERGVPSPVRLQVWVRFYSPKTLELFLNPDRPWISLEAARKMVEDTKTKAWFAQVKNVKAFKISSKSGEEETGLIPVDTPLKALVHAVKSGDKQYFRVRLITGTRDEWKEHELPERFKVLPSKFVPRKSC